MGNTNFSQFGAADTTNSFDTLVGEQQLTDNEKAQRDQHSKAGIASLLPDTSANESRRVIEHVEHRNKVPGKRAPRSVVASPDQKNVTDQHATEADREALAGHVDTGRSAPDAT